MRKIDIAVIEQLFAKFSERYGPLWKSRHQTSHDWLSAMETWVEDLQDFDLETLKTAVAKSIKIHTEFPPTLGQIVKLCLENCNLPSEDAIINAMIRREFTHPLIKLVYDKVGSWTLKNGKAEEVKAKTKEAYNQCLHDFLSNPQESWLKLNTHNEQLLLSQDTPTQEDKPHINIYDRMKQYAEAAIAESAKSPHNIPPVFDKHEVNPQSKSFKQATFDAYKKYLLSIPETGVVTLPVAYAYDRTRFLTQIEVEHRMQKIRFNTQQQAKNWKETKAYKD